MSHSTLERPSAPKDPSNREPSVRRKIIIGGTSLILAAGATLGVKEFVSSERGSAEDPGKQPDTSSSDTLENTLVPEGISKNDVDPNAKLKPLNERVDAKFIPRIINDEYELGLVQPGSVEDEVQGYCNQIASVISSDRMDLLINNYGNTPGSAYQSDEELNSEFVKTVDQIKSTYPATEKPLLAIECSDVEVAPEKYANGSHRASFSLSASVIDKSGNIYSKSLWDGSNILQNRTLTLNRDGTLINKDGTMRTGILAEFSEVADQ